jgi:hypothetical protein
MQVGLQEVRMKELVVLLESRWQFNIGSGGEVDYRPISVPFPEGDNVIELDIFSVSSIESLFNRILNEVSEGRKDLAATNLGLAITIHSRVMAKICTLL